MFMYCLLAATPLEALEERGVEFDNPFLILYFKRKSKNK